MPESGKLTSQQTGALLDAGLATWRAVLEQMESRGIDQSFASSVLAVAVAGALTAEGNLPEEFLEVVTMSLSLWRNEASAGGPVLVFNHPLSVAPRPETEAN